MESYRPKQTSMTFQPPEQKRTRDRHTVNAYRRGYDRRWKAARDGFLQHHPLCRRCEEAGKVTAAWCVDHIQPWTSAATFEEQRRLFWDSTNNWQPLCRDCHDCKTAEDKLKYPIHPPLLQ